MPPTDEGLRRQRLDGPRPLPARHGCMTTTPATAAAPARVKTYPVIEIFGPTIQGEGAEAGLATHFLRVGGCDYRCSWCDTMYAVDPAEVRANSRHLSREQIIEEIDALA